MTRKWLLTLFVLVIFAVSAGMAYFALRNRIADRFSAFLFWRGTGLSIQQADHLERELNFDPNDFADRIELLSFYSFRKIDGTLSEDQMLKRRTQVLWVIEHEPSSHFASDFAVSFDPEGEESDVEGLRQAEELWLRQVDANPSNSRILYNAGEFFSLVHNWQKSEQLLERACEIDPHSYDIASSLGVDYWHDARYAATSEEGRISSSKALKEFDRAMRNAQTEDQRRYVLPDAAQAAYESGEFKEASDLSTEMLSMAKEQGRSEDYSDEIHYGNLVLGLIALQNGDTKSAGAHLVESAAISGNPHLDTFGPNMTLAKELLEKGDRKSVLEYLESCSKFWKMGDKKLTEWRADIVAGKMPDFGPNLRY